MRKSPSAGNARRKLLDDAETEVRQKRDAFIAAKTRITHLIIATEFCRLDASRR
jgi:hypothetical protein